MMAITLPPDGWVRNFLSGGGPGRFHCIDYFLNIWVLGVKPGFIFCYMTSVKVFWIDIVHFQKFLT